MVARTRSMWPTCGSTLDPPKNFFDDPEDPKVQAVQGLNPVEDGRREGTRCRFKEKKQRIPIVLTCDGDIVDGNRRVAALQKQKQPFVSAVILPEDADRLDIFETELNSSSYAIRRPNTTGWMLIHLRYGKELGGKLDDLPTQADEPRRPEE